MESLLGLGGNILWSAPKVAASFMYVVPRICWGMWKGAQILIFCYISLTEGEGVVKLFNWGAVATSAPLKVIEVNVCTGYITSAALFCVRLLSQGVNTWFCLFANSCFLSGRLLLWCIG